jgi:hypothetical protein
MSRTRNNNEETKNNFPMAEAVPNCYLKSIKYKKTKEKELVTLSFKNGEDWVQLWLENPKRSNFDTDEDWKKERIRVTSMFENVLYTFLKDGDLMKEVRRESTDFRTYYENVVKYIEKVKYWETPLEVKTVPKKNGDPTVAKYPPFMRSQGDLNMNLKYSSWEERRVIEWKRKL